MTKKIVAQGRGSFHIYESNMFGVDYVSSKMTLMTGNANMFFVEDEGYTIEIDKSEELENFINKDQTYGMLFMNSLSKDNPQMFQVFLMTPIDSDNPNKLKFKLDKYRNKQAIGWLMREHPYDDYVKELTKDPLYIIDRY